MTLTITPLTITPLSPALGAQVHLMNHAAFTRKLLAALALTGLTLSVQAANLTIGYITGIDPAKLPIADGTFEKVIGEKIDWCRFDAGPAVVAAMASGDVQIGNLGSSPFIAPR